MAVLAGPACRRDMQDQPKYKPLASTGDYEAGVVIGEYTLEFRNESAHGLIRGLSGS